MNYLISKLASGLLSGILAISCITGCANNTDSSGSGSQSDSEEVTDIPEETEAVWDELDASEITAAMGLGWNLGNQLEASSNGVPSETAWGNPVITEDLLKTVKDAGFSTVRIPVSYLSMIGEGPDYTVDAAWFDRIEQVVNYVLDNDMFAIINVHGDGYYTVNGSWLLCAEDDEAQKEITAKYKALWTQIAERFAKYDEHLIFESMNEEFNNNYGKPDSSAYENINKYNEIFVESVRSTGGNNAKRWLLMPGWNTNVDYTSEEYGFRIPEDPLCESDGNRIMISVHYYDPYNFTLDESISSCTTQWGKYATEKFDNWGQEDYVDNQMKKLSDNFTSKGYPVVIGEMGVISKSLYDKNSDAYRRYWYEYVVKAAKKVGAIPVCWDNGYNGNKGFGLFSRTACSVTQPELIEAVIRAITATEDYEIPKPEPSEEAAA